MKITFSKIASPNNSYFGSLSKSKSPSFKGDKYTILPIFKLDSQSSLFISPVNNFLILFNNAKFF